MRRKNKIFIGIKKVNYLLFFNILQFFFQKSMPLTRFSTQMYL